MTARAEPRLVDESARRLAAGELDRNIVVSAGAGTGKTRLLIDRLTLLIVGREITVDKIVAMTFTKKAAEEMRDRLEKRLREIIENPDAMPLLSEQYPSGRDRRAAVAAKALDDIPKAQIGTIHSFAGHLLRLYPVQAGVDPAFREDDGTGFESLFEREWRRWLGVELALGSPREKQWRAWLAAFDLSDLRAAARALTENESAIPALAEKDDPKPLMRVSSEAIDRLIEEYGIPKRSRVLAPRLEAMRRVFDAVGSGKNPLPDDVAEVEKLKAPTEWEGREPESILQALRRRALLAAVIDEKAVAAVVAAVTPFVRRLRQEMTRRGLVTFDDLLLKARNLLRDHPTVRAALKRQFHTFLVDEFQDTDPLQGEILFYLAERPDAEAHDWREVSLAQGRLFVVGDPKQSIYRFRGADIAAFEEFWKRMLDQDALQASLTSNFRSERHIIECVNAVFSRIMRHEPYLQPAYEALDCGFAGEGGPACETMLVSTGDGAAPPVDTLRAFEGELIAERIEKTIGTVVNGAPVAYRDVAILLRTTNSFAPYLDALRERGIPFLAEGEKSYFRRPEIAELSNFLAVLCDPSDALALAGVLRSPVGGLTDAEVLALRNANSLNFRFPPKILREKVGTLFEALRRLHALAHARPVPDVIRALYDETGLLELAAGRRHGEQAVANLRKAAQMAETWLESEPMTLPDFVRKLALYRDEKRDEGENPLADVQYDAVRVMTIHKAKGLEFRCVFLPNISGTFGSALSEPDVVLREWRTGAAGFRLPAAGVVNGARLLIDEEIRRREEAEELRVFYVAATRAKERLIFVARDPAPARAPFADFLTRAGAWPVNGAALASAGGVDIGVTHAPWAPTFGQKRASAGLTLPAGWTPAALGKTLSVRDAESERCRSTRLILTPTSQLHAGETEKNLLRDEEADLDRTPAILIGHICHSVLEGWDFASSAKSAGKRLKESVALAARLHGLLEESDGREETLAEATSILTTFLSSPAGAALAAAKIEGREVPFFYPLETGDSPRLMRGVIDLVYRDAKGQLVIADYKTNRVDADTIDAVAASYRAQGEIYATALKKITGETAAFELLFLRTGEARRLRP